MDFFASILYTQWGHNESDSSSKFCIILENSPDNMHVDDNTFM